MFEIHKNPDFLTYFYVSENLREQCFVSLIKFIEKINITKERIFIYYKITWKTLPEKKVCGNAIMTGEYFSVPFTEEDFNFLSSIFGKNLQFLP